MQLPCYQDLCEVKFIKKDLCEVKLKTYYGATKTIFRYLQETKVCSTNLLLLQNYSGIQTTTEYILLIT